MMIAARAVEKSGPLRNHTAASFLSAKRLFQLHGWLGMTFGSLLMVICFTGAAAAVSHEIDWLVNPAIRVSPEQGSYQSWQAWTLSAQKAHPDWKLISAEAPLSKRYAVEFLFQAPSGQVRRVYVNPYSATVQGGSSFLNAQRFLRDLHRLLNLGLPGLFFVCGFSLVLLFSVVSGMLFYKNWWRNLFQLRLHKGQRAFISDVHRLLGTWTLMFAVVISVTGVWYLINYSMAVAGVQEEIISVPPAKMRNYPALLPPLDLDRSLHSVRRDFPDLQVKSIRFPATAGGTLQVSGQARAKFVSNDANSVILDPDDGSVLQVQRANQLSLFQRWPYIADLLHFGYFGGLVTKLLWCFLGFTIPALVLAGGFLSVQRSRSRSSNVIPNTRVSFIRRWSLATWISVFVMFGVVLQSVPAATQYKTPLSPVFVNRAQLQVGPWLLKIAAANRQVRASIDCLPCRPNFKSLLVSSTGENGSFSDLKPIGNYWISDPIKTGSNGEQNLTIRVIDWTGSLHTGQVSMPCTTINSQLRHHPEEGPFMAEGLSYVLVLFMAAMVMLFAIWVSSLGQLSAPTIDRA